MYIPRIWDTSIEHTYNTIYIIYTTTPHQLTYSKQGFLLCNFIDLYSARSRITSHNVIQTSLVFANGDRQRST
jgi:hypothetical protein